MPSLIPAEVMAQMYLARSMPNTTGMGPTGFQGAAPPDQGMSMVRAQNALRGQPAAGSMTPAAGPRGMSPLNNEVAMARLMDSFDVPEDQRDKWKGVPFQQAHTILSAQAQQKHQRALMQQQLQVHQQTMAHQKDAEGRQARLEQEKLRHQSIGETNTELHDETAQERELQDRLNKGEEDPGINKDLTAVRQRLMQTRGRLNQFMQPQQVAQGGQTAQGGQGRQGGQALQPPQGKLPLTPQVIQHFLQVAGNDKEKAKLLARQAGY